MSGRISFIGAGPGAADLITVRGARRIAEADVVVWAASLVAPECIQEHARSDAELVDSSRLTHEEAVEIYRRAERDKLNVARVHSGDPSLWGAVQEQYDVCARMNVEVEIVPGVAAFSAAAAAAGRELTVPEIAQSVVLTRLEGGKTPMPAGEKVRQFAEHGTTMALFLSAARTGQLVEELRAGGYPDDTPVLIAYKVTWPDELLLRTTLGELEVTVKQHKLWRHTLFLVGKALTEGGTRSHLYHAGHFHTYRRADPAARRALREQNGASRRARGAERTVRDSTQESTNTSSDDSVPQQRSEQPGSDVAWWAVRDWQQTARGVTRVASERASARRSEVDGQPGLFVHDAAGASAVTEPEQALAHEQEVPASEEKPAPKTSAIRQETTDAPAATATGASAGSPAAQSASPAGTQPRAPKPKAKPKATQKSSGSRAKAGKSAQSRRKPGSTGTTGN